MAVHAETWGTPKRGKTTRSHLFITKPPTTTCSFLKPSQNQLKAHFQGHYEGSFI